MVSLHLGVSTKGYLQHTAGVTLQWASIPWRGGGGGGEKNYQLFLATETEKISYRHVGSCGWCVHVGALWLVCDFGVVTFSPHTCTDNPWIIKNDC